MIRNADLACQILGTGSLVREDGGHQIVGLPGGQKLLETMQAEAPALVLLDIQLPGEDGFQLLAKLQATLGDTLPPVVALTAHAMSGDEEKALAAGFTGYLTKPIDVGTFGSTVEAFIPPA